MTVTFVASFINDTAITANYGNSITNAATYTGVAAGRLAILSVVTRTETMTYSTPTNGTWTNLTTLTGGDTAHGVDSVVADNGLTMMGAWYQVLGGSETGNVFTATTPNTTTTPNNCQVANMLSYSTDQTGFATPIAVSGNDSSHATTRSVTFGTWASALQTGDVIVVINGIDTDNQAGITSPTLTQTGTTFNSPTFRTKAFSTTQADQAHYIWEFTVASGGSTNAPTFTWTGGPASCGPAIAVRVRDIPANPPQTVNLSLVTGSSVVQAITGAKQKALALTSVSQTAQVITKQKMKAIALTSDLATAQTFTYSRRQTVNLITNTQTAQAVTARFSGRVNQVTETDSAFTHGKKKSKELTLLFSDNFVQSLAGQHQLALNRAEETDSVFALNEVKLQDIEVVLEDNIAQPLTIGRRKAINIIVSNNLAIVLGTTYRLFQVIETDSIPATQRLKRRTLALLTETDIPNDIHPFHTDLVAQLTENDTSQPLHIIYSRLVHQTTETDIPNSIHPIHTDAVGTVFETDFAQVIDNFVKQKLLTLVTGSDIAVAVGPKLQHPPSSIILDVVIPDPTQLTVTILDSDVIVLVSQRF